VDREDGRQAGVAGVGLARRGQPRDGRRGVPVVGVDNVGPPAEGRHREVERRTAEKGEAVRVVGVAVEEGPVAEQAALGEEIDGDRAAGQRRLQHARRDGSEAHGHAQRDRVRLDAVCAGAGGGLDRGVSRHRCAHVVAEGGQRLGQRAAHVGEAAGLGERRDLRA
jgi:hypothetical protein